MKKAIAIATMAAVGILAAGCGESVPVNPLPKDGSNPHVSGTPQERIANIQADPMLTPEERAQRIKAIKERNNLP
jgi:hypothetical protein